MTRRTDRTTANRITDDRPRGLRTGGLGRRAVALAFAVTTCLGFVPVASAHGGHVSIGGVHLSQWYALIPLVLGIGITVGSAYLPRVLRPEYARHALYGVFFGLVVAVVGGIGLVQLAPYEWLTAQPVIPRALHEPLMLSLGVAIMLGSVVYVQYRWPLRPRYAGLGVLLGCWVAYPGLSLFGLYAPTNPLGYGIVLTLPVAVGYVLWRDARDVLEQLWTDRVARRFGAAVGLLGIVFFLFSAGMVTVVPDDGVGLSWSQSFIKQFPVQGPLVLWPAIEFWFPDIPFTGMVSVGTVVLLGTLGGLLGLNAAVFALQWGGPSGAGTSQTTAGIAGVAAPQACCCCGPLLSQMAIVTLGPSAAAPIYLLFADPSSSIGSLFFVASVGILTGTLVHAAQATPGNPDTDQSPTPA